MTIRYEMQPEERDNIITKTEAFINSITQEFYSMDPEERDTQILAELRCAQRIIEAEVDMRYETRRIRIK